MHRVSASASRSLPSQDLRRYSYKLSYHADQDAKKALSACRCAMPDRPDEWSDKMWRKYLTAMARLPCKVCKTEPVLFALPTQSSVPQGSTTSLMRLLSKGKRHYKERKKDGDEVSVDAPAHGAREQQRKQQQQQQLEKQHDGEGDAGAEGLCSTPFCATNTPSSAVEASAAAAVFPRRKKGAAPWEEE